MLTIPPSRKATPSEDARVAVQPGFAWDGQQAYLFDIDGTLLRSRDRVHFNSFASGVLGVTGYDVKLDGVTLHGNIDTAILREACVLAGMSASVIEQSTEAILQAMRDHVDERRQEMEPVVMPGVEEVLAHLAAKGALLGVATGNLEAIGWIKLEEAGLRKWFGFGGFADSFSVRSAVLAHAASTARELAGEGATVCVVGDTPRDIEAARANSLSVIAVATGNSSYDELLTLEPDVCASSLAHLLAFQGTAP